MSKPQTLADRQALKSDVAASIVALTGKTNNLRWHEQFKGCRSIDDPVEVETPKKWKKLMVEDLKDEVKV